MTYRLLLEVYLRQDFMRYYNYVPENLDIDAILEEVDFMNIPAFSKDSLCFILNSVAIISSRYKDAISENEYAPVNAKILQHWVGRNYKMYIDLLIAAKVIERDGRYVSGEKSIGYRYCNQYRKGIKKLLITDLALIKKLIAYEKEYDLEITGQDDCHKLHEDIRSQYLPAIKWYKSELIKIDSDLANNYANSVFEYKHADKKLWDKGIDGKLKSPYTQLRAAQISIDKIESKRFNQHADNNVYRLHSIITQLKKELRNAIKIDEKEVVAVDISNSQPTLLALLIDPKFWDEKSSFNYTKIPYLDIQSIFASDSHQSTFIKLCKNAEHNSNMIGEIDKFKDLVASGMFYEEFRSLLEQKLGIKGLDRHNVKAMFFTVLFTNNHFIHQKEAAPKRVFKEWFPYIYELCNRIKAHNHANLPILLQRMESYIMFSCIIARIGAEKPELPFIPIHDSIAVPVGNEVYVETIMSEELNKCLGFTPNFKREEWKASILEDAILNMDKVAIAA